MLYSTWQSRCHGWLSSCPACCPAHRVRAHQAGNPNSLAAEQAVVAALHYVTDHNSYALLSTAQAAVVEGWQQVTMVRAGSGCPGGGSCAEHAHHCTPIIHLQWALGPLHVHACACTISAHVMLQLYTNTYWA